MRQWIKRGCAIAAAAAVAAALGGCSKKDGTGSGFSYSAGLTETGFWEGVTALDYVTLPLYDGVEIAKEVHDITDEAVEEEIDGQELLSGITSTQRYYFCKVVHHASWQAHLREEIAFEPVRYHVGAASDDQLQNL